MQWADVPMPTLKSNEVSVQIKAAGINPTDIKLRNGDMRPFSAFIGPFPRNMGTDFAGLITAIGDGVKEFSVGDKVYGGTELKGGGFADYLAIDAKQLRRIPNGLDFAQASMLKQNGGTAITTVNNHVKPTPGLTVLVNGAGGGIGLFIMQICKAKGAIVTAVAASQSSALLKELGADAIIDYKAADVLKQGKLYDVIVDASAQMKFNAAQDILKKHGTFYTLTPTFASFVSQVLNIFRSKKENNLITHPAPAADMRDLDNLVTSGAVKCIVGKTFPMRDVIDVHKRYEAGEIKVTGKVVLVAE